MTEGTDYTFLTVGDGGPATAAFTRGDIAAYSASTADAAILNQRGVTVRDITPPEYARFFGNGLATTGALIRDNPELVEKFGRAFARGHAFALDDANREKVLAHLAAGNPPESEDPAFASALFDAVRSKTIPIDASKGLGYQPPEVWEEWQQSLIAGGDLAGAARRPDRRLHQRLRRGLERRPEVMAQPPQPRRSASRRASRSTSCRGRRQDLRQRTPSRRSRASRSP